METQPEEELEDTGVFQSVPKAKFHYITTVIVVEEFDTTVDLDLYTKEERDEHIEKNVLGSVFSAMVNDRRAIVHTELECVEYPNEDIVMEDC